MMRTAAALGACALLAPATLAAQRFEATVFAQSGTYRVRATGPVEEASSMYPGGGAALWLGSLRIGVEGVFGADKPKTAEGFKVRTTTLSAGVRAVPFEFGLEAAARHRSASAGAVTSLVRLAGPYATGIADFGGGFNGLATIAVYPVRTSLNTDPLGLAMRAEIGARYTPREGALSFFTSYRLLRLDYRQVGGGPARLEQDAGMFFGVTWSSGNR